ncbi:MAG: hypothetical protein NTU88_15075, partial [Armatimonadetes bacterium]|nr:hypothetical protein [Armatimonadota bacterium]
LAAWVRKGGTLVLFGGTDAYNDLPEWWQKAGFASPQDHLLAELGCPAGDGAHTVGKGTVIIVTTPPSYFASSKKSAAELRAVVSRACEKAGIAYRESHSMIVRRGRYVAVRTFDQPVQLKGQFVDVLDPGIRFVTNPTIKADDLSVMADVGKLIADSKPRILLTSCRIEASSETASLTSLLVSGPLKTKGVVRLSTAGKKVRSISVEDQSGKPIPFEQKLESGTLFITHAGLPEGVLIKVGWK